MSADSTTMPPEEIRISTDSWTEPFWQAAREERLVAPRCNACGTFRFPPTPFCPNCQSQDVAWPELPAEASVFSYSIVRGLPGSPDLVLVPAVIEFEGIDHVHVVSNVVGADPDEVSIGDRVRVEYVDIADGWKLPVFRPIEA